MKNSVCLLALLLLVFSYNINSQVNQEWVQRYNSMGNQVDEAKCITIDGSGNVYVTGRSSGGSTSYDYVTISYNPFGGVRWIQRYNGTGNNNDEAYSIFVDVSGNVYVTGKSSGGGTGSDFATIKYDSSGVEQWVQRYNRVGNSTEEARSVVVDDIGNVYVTGYSVGPSPDDYVTIKYDSSGIIQWVQIYNGPRKTNDEAYSIAVDVSGNVYVTGISIGIGTGYDYATIKYNSSGVVQWVQRYNRAGGSTEEARSVVVDDAGNVYVTGRSNGPSLDDYVTIKYDSSGIKQWVQIYNGPGNAEDRPTSLVVDPYGNVYVSGLSKGSGTSNDYATIKYNSSGIEQWIQRYNGQANINDEAYSMAVDIYGNVYVTGGSGRIETSYDYATVKYDSSGLEQWVYRYDASSSGDIGTSITVDISGNVYVTGYSFGFGTSNDYATIKYSQFVGIQPISTEIPNQYSLSQNYPNPFNPVTKIKFAIPVRNSRDHSLIKIYDALGRELSTLINQELSPGTYEIDWNASAYPSGVYYYKIISGSFSETKKMVLIK